MIDKLLTDIMLSFLMRNFIVAILKIFKLKK